MWRKISPNMPKNTELILYCSSAKYINDGYFYRDNGLIEITTEFYKKEYRLDLVPYTHYIVKSDLAKLVNLKKKFTPDLIDQCNLVLDVLETNIELKHKQGIIEQLFEICCAVFGETFKTSREFCRIPKQSHIDFITEPNPDGRLEFEFISSPEESFEDFIHRINRRHASQKKKSINKQTTMGIIEIQKQQKMEKQIKELANQTYSLIDYVATKSLEDKWKATKIRSTFEDHIQTVLSKNTTWTVMGLSRGWLIYKQYILLECKEKKSKKSYYDGVADFFKLALDQELFELKLDI